MTSELPLVTVMIPTYGQAPILPRAIGSALAQSYPNLQVVVADDASPDDTRAAVSPFTGDPRFEYVRRPRNLGRTANYRKTLVDDARGELVLNLDGDDWLLDSSYLARAVSLFNDHPGLALVFARVYDYSPRTGYHETTVNRRLPTVSSGRELLLAYADGTVSIPHAAALYDRALALRRGFYLHDCVGSDTVALLSLLPGNSVGFVDTVAAAWNKHGANATFSTPPQTRLHSDRLVVDAPSELILQAETLSPRELRRWRRRMGARWGLSYIEDCIAAGRWADAWRYGAGLLASRPGAGATLLTAAFAEASHQLRSGRARRRTDART